MPSPTRCGDSNEWVSAAVHGLVSLLYLAMLTYHTLSTVEHVQRGRGEPK